jgi:hypothetical protein
LRKLADLRCGGLRLRGEQRLHFFAKRLAPRIGHTPAFERHEDSNGAKDCDDCCCDPSHHALVLYRECGGAQAANRT